LFIIFTIAYIIIFAFIRAIFKFIKIMTIVPAKGLLGILGLFYNNSKGIKKREESKQPIKLQNFFKLKYAIPTPTFIILGINNP